VNQAEVGGPQLESLLSSAGISDLLFGYEPNSLALPVNSNLWNHSAEDAYKADMNRRFVRMFDFAAFA
jgi:hypothetical protein